MSPSSVDLSKNELRMSVSSSLFARIFKHLSSSSRHNLSLSPYERICSLLPIIWSESTKWTTVPKQPRCVPLCSPRNSKNERNIVSCTCPERIDLERSSRLARSSQEQSTGMHHSNSQDDHDVTMTEHGDPPTNHDTHSTSIHPNQSALSDTNGY